MNSWVDVFVSKCARMSAGTRSCLVVPRAFVLKLSLSLDASQSLSSPCAHTQPSATPQALSGALELSTRQSAATVPPTEEERTHEHHRRRPSARAGDECERKVPAMRGAVR